MFFSSFLWPHHGDNKESSYNIPHERNIVHSPQASSGSESAKQALAPSLLAHHGDNKESSYNIPRERNIVHSPQASSGSESAKQTLTLSLLAHHGDNKESSYNIPHERNIVHSPKASSGSESVTPTSLSGSTLFACGEFYCCAVLFGCRRVIFASRVIWRMEYHFCRRQKYHCERRCNRKRTISRRQSRHITLIPQISSCALIFSMRCADRTIIIPGSAYKKETFSFSPSRCRS